MSSVLGLDTAAQRLVFITYMMLWVSYGLLNELAKRNDVHFNSTAAVVLQSIIKLCIASYLFLSSDTTAIAPVLPSKTRVSRLTWVQRFSVFFHQFRENKNLLLRYLVPSGLYVLYDVLAYANLRRFDASTYFLLLQFRLVITGLLHQLMFDRKLNRNQWLSLFVITFGCTIKTLGATAERRSENEPATVDFMAYILLFIQLLSSTFAGVYNEALLKHQPNVSVNLQNVFMYIDSIICTMCMLAFGLTGQTMEEAFTWSNWQRLFTVYVLPMVLIMSFIGVVTGLFLKLLDSVRKAIASALELVALPLLAAVLFSAPIPLSTIVAVGCVASGVYIYSVPVPVHSNSQNLDDKSEA